MPARKAPAKRPSPSKRPLPPPNQALLAEAHALVDTILRDHPSSSAVMIVVADALHTNAASIPHTWSTKRGMIDVLHEKIHGESE